MMNVI